MPNPNQPNIISQYSTKFIQRESKCYDSQGSIIYRIFYIMNFLTNIGCHCYHSLIYQHLSYGNKFYNFWKWKMGALIKIKCKIFNFQKENDDIPCTTYTQLAWFAKENDDVKS